MDKPLVCILGECSIVPAWEQGIENDAQILFHFFGCNAAGLVASPNDVNCRCQAGRCDGATHEGDKRLDCIKQHTVTPSTEVRKAARFDRIELRTLAGCPGSSGVKLSWHKTILDENQTDSTNFLPADVNGDGKVDWVASRGHGIGVIWFENPTWKIHDIDTTIEFPHSLTVADHDQDGDLDLLNAGRGTQNLAWYENPQK